MGYQWAILEPSVHLLGIGVMLCTTMPDISFRKISCEVYYKSCFHDEHGRGLTLTPAMLVRTGQGGKKPPFYRKCISPLFIILFICY